MLIYGKNVFEETVRVNENLVDTIYIKKGYVNKYKSKINNKNLINPVKDNFFQNNLRGKKHQNVALEINNFPIKGHNYLKENFNHNNIFILLDSIKDPYNLGNIIRTAYGLDIDGVIITKDRTAGITPAVFASSSGYINRIPIISITNPANMIKMFKDWTYWIATVDMQGDKNLKTDTDKIPLPMVICMGSEGRGIRETYKKKSDFSLYIPQKKDFDSFNLSNAATIAMWEISKLKK